MGTGAVGAGTVGVWDVGARGCWSRGLLLPGASPHCPLQPHGYTHEGKIPLTPNSASNRGQSGYKGKSVRAGQAHGDLLFPFVPLQPPVIQLPKLSMASPGL